MWILKHEYHFKNHNYNLYKAIDSTHYAELELINNNIIVTNVLRLLTHMALESSNSAYLT